MPLPINPPIFLPQSMGPGPVGPVFFARHRKVLNPTLGVISPPSPYIPPADFLPYQLGPKAMGPVFFATRGVRLPRLTFAPTQLVSGSVSPTGQTQKAITYPLQGGLSFLTTFLTPFTVIFSAGLSFVGAMSRSARKTFMGTVSFTGRVIKLTQFPLIGATLTFVGQRIKRIGVVVAGSLSFVGAPLKRSNTVVVSSVLTFQGNVRRAIVAILNTGVLSFTGKVSRLSGVVVTGGLSFTGRINRSMTRSLAGGLSAGGVITRAITHRLVGSTLSFVGSGVKQWRHKLAGALSFVGAFLSHKSRFDVTPIANLSFTTRFEAMGAVDTIYQPVIPTYLGVYPDELLMQMPDFQFQLVEAPRRQILLAPNDPMRTK